MREKERAISPLNLRLKLTVDPSASYIPFRGSTKSCRIPTSSGSGTVGPDHGEEMESGDDGGEGGGDCGAGHGRVAACEEVSLRIAFTITVGEVVNPVRHHFTIPPWVTLRTGGLIMLEKLLLHRRLRTTGNGMEMDEPTR